MFAVVLEHSEDKEKHRLLQEELYDDELTQQGYDKRLRQILVARGVIGDGTEVVEDTTPAPAQYVRAGNVRNKLPDKPPVVVNDCAKERDELKERVAALTAELSTLKHQFGVTETTHASSATTTTFTSSATTSSAVQPHQRGPSKQ